MKEIQIKENDAGQRLDKFLTKALPALPQSLLYKSIRCKRIKCNGKRCEISTRLQTGDILSLYLNDEFFIPQTEKSFLSVPTALDILYEDENLILVDKKPGLVVHEDAADTKDTLISRIQHYLYETGAYDPAQENSFAPALCNRIDRNTGGIVLAAKNAATLRVLNEKIKNREIEKQYLCIVHGKMEKPSGTLKAWLYKDSSANQVQVFDHPVPEGRTILTRYRVLGQQGRFSLLEVDLLTGRTHQIRAHFAHIGHPLLGDTKYGRCKEDKKMGYPYQALYSCRVTFAFQGHAEHLEYLTGKSFQAKKIPFQEAFFAGKIK